MNLQRARYLVALADTANFTRAAAGLHIAQSALSQQIKLLEREIGVALLDRRGPHFTFTAAGEVAIGEARFLLEFTERSLDRIRRAAHTIEGQLKLAYTRSWSGGAVGDLVNAYRAEFPGVEIVVLRGTTSHNVDLVRGGTVDIAVVRPPIVEHDLTTIVLDSEPIMIAVPTGHPLADRTVIDRAELIDAPVVFWPRDNAPGMFTRTLEQLWPNGSPRIVRYEADDEQVLHAVAEGVGLAPIPRGRARTLTVPGVHLCEVSGEPATLDVAIAYRPDNPNPPLDQFVALALRSA